MVGKQTVDSDSVLLFEESAHLTSVKLPHEDVGHATHAGESAAIAE